MKDKNICKFISGEGRDTLTVSCFVSECNAQVMRKRSIMKTHRMLLVTSGEGKLMAEGREYPYSLGALFFLFEGESFSLVDSCDSSYMYIDFIGGRAEELMRRFSITPKNRAFSGFEGLIPMWKESLARADVKTVDLAAESMLLYTLSRLSSRDTAEGGIVNRILEMTEENFRDPRLSLSLIAEDIFYNPKYLSHVFKTQTGVGYSEYLRKMRIKYAITLFDHGLDSVKNVSVLSGFSDSLYFSNVFKKEVGISPSEYIRSRSEGK